MQLIQLCSMSEGPLTLPSYERLFVPGSRMMFIAANGVIKRRRRLMPSGKFLAGEPADRRCFCRWVICDSSSTQFSHHDTVSLPTLSYKIYHCWSFSSCANYTHTTLLLPWTSPTHLVIVATWAKEFCYYKGRRLQICNQVCYPHCNYKFDYVTATAATITNL